MARKRSPEHDYICRRCGCPCDFTKHIGGGQGMRACGQAPDVVLRSAYEAEIKADLEAIFGRRASPGDAPR